MHEIEKILVVEDNKALAKLLSKKIESNTHFEVDVAHSLQEAQAHLSRQKKYFLALLDLVLPDAPNGEVVDFMLAKQVPSIVLTANVDAATREAILQKDVIDYVFKGNMDDVNYIFTLIERLWKNRSYKVMIVDDAIPIRNEVKKILQKQMYQVLSAAHGEEALAYINDHPDVKLILTDSSMPVIDGMELTKTLREEYSKMQMAIIALCSNDDKHLSAKFLKMGASDFINKPFTSEELVCRVNNAIESLEFIETISDMANKDRLTGLSNRSNFFTLAKEYLSQNTSSDISFALAMIDIDDFKKINDVYGHDHGDLVIKHLANVLKESTKGSDIVARFSSEEFCILLKDIPKQKAVEFFVKLRHKISQNTLYLADTPINFTVSLGIACNAEEGLDEMLNEADMALYRAKSSGKNRVELAQG